MSDQELILNEIKQERQYQDTRWGNEFDDENTVNDWAAYILTYVSNARLMPTDKERFERQMIKVAALAVAAVEASRRNNGCAPTHYDD